MTVGLKEPIGSYEYTIPFSDGCCDILNIIPLLALKEVRSWSYKSLQFIWALLVILSFMYVGYSIAESTTEYLKKETATKVSLLLFRRVPNQDSIRLGYFAQKDHLRLSAFGNMPAVVDRPSSCSVHGTFR